MRNMVGLAVLLAVAVEPVSATVTGSVVVQNGTTGALPGTIKYSPCSTNASYVTCTSFSNVPTSSSITATVTDTRDGTGTHYGLSNVYITYYPTGDNPGVTATPYCEWQANIQSNGSGQWSGMVTVYTGSDAGYNGGAGYTPSCKYSNFSVNSTTGNWTLNLDWAR